MSSELEYEDYTISWICALPFEATAAMLIDEDVVPKKGSPLYIARSSPSYSIDN